MEVTREQMKQEALNRMKMLGILPEAQKSFEKDCRLFKSEGPGILYWLDEQERQMVKEWEDANDYMVYHVIKNKMGFGMCYSLLYVSNDDEEWEIDREDIKERAPLVFVKNVNAGGCSEFGTIWVQPWIGRLVRTA